MQPRSLKLPRGWRQRRDCRILCFMKMVRAFVLMGWSLAHTACGGAHFDVSSSGQTQIDAGETPGPKVLLGMSPFVITDNVVLKAQGIGTGRITQAYPTEITLTVAKPAGGVDLGFLTGASVTVTASGLPTLALATATQFPKNQNLVVIQLAAKRDISRYLRTKNCTIGLTLAGSPPPESVSLRMDMQISVDVDNKAVLFE